jgi:hypothetical protein
MNITDFMTQNKKKINGLKDRSMNEAQTKEWLIRPFFEMLHWDFSNPDEVVPEDDDSSGKKPDYGFYCQKKVKFFVEAKPINTNIADIKIITEKLNYCNNANVPFLIITNGVEYAIYYTGLKGSNKDKLLQSFSLMDEIIDDEIINKLYKEAFEQDILYTYAKNLSVFTNVKSAIETLFQHAHKKIIDLINEEIKTILGHKFGDDDIRNALKHFNLEISDEPYSSEPMSEESEQTTKQNDSNWTIEHQFKQGKWKNSFELYQKLIKYFVSNNIVFTEKPTKFYVGWLHNEKNYVQIHGQRSGLKVWISIKFNELSEQERLKSRDVSHIGHWGMGETEYIVKNERDFDMLVGIVKKAFDKTK